MNGLEQFKPQLKTGRISPQGSSIVYETDSPVDQIILPIETLDFLTQCNGQLSLTEIIENIYRKKNTIQFKLIYQTLLSLKEKGFLENGHHLNHIESLHFEKEGERFLTFTPVWNFSLGRRILNDSTHPLLFYFFSLAISVGAILSLQSFSDSWLQFSFLQVNNSYASGFIFTFLCASFLLSAKNAIKAVLLLFLTGRIYNFNLTFNGFALYFRISSDSLFLVQNKLFRALFHSANFLSYFAIIYLCGLIDSSYLGYAFPAAVALLMFDLNPYQPSEASALLRLLLKNDTLNRLANYLEYHSPLALISPYDSYKNKKALATFTNYAFIWSAAALWMLLHSFGDHFLNILSTIRSSNNWSDVSEVASGLFSLSVIVSLTLIVGYNFYRLIKLYFNPWPAISRRLALATQRKIDITQRDKDLIIHVLQEFSLFSHFSTQLLEQIVQKSELREVKRHALILARGEKCTDLQILITGQAAAEDRLISAPAIFGEASFLENPVQMQEVTALTSCYVLTIPSQFIFELQANDIHCREIESFKNSILVTQYFANASLFRDVNDEISRLFINKGKIETFKKDHVLFKQGDLADGFYLLLKGTIEVVVHNRPLTQIHEGGFFGEISMIADIPRTATIYATQDCKTLRISREAFWEILAKDINMAMFIESVGEMRVQEDVDLLRIA